MPSDLIIRGNNVWISIHNHAEFVRETVQNHSLFDASVTQHQLTNVAVVLHHFAQLRRNFLRLNVKQKHRKTLLCLLQQNSETKNAF